MGRDEGAYRPRRGFDVDETVLVGQLLAFLAGDDPLIPLIALVGDDDAAHVAGRVLIEAPYPARDGVEALRIGHIIHQRHALRSAVVSLCDSLYDGQEDEGK